MFPRQGFRHLLVGVLVAACALALAATSSAKAPRSFYGVVPQTPLADGDFDRMGEARVGTLRAEFFWSGIDPDSGDNFDWSGPDRVVGEAARNGIEVLPFLFSTPKWVAELDGHNCDAADCPPFAPKGREALAAWENFAAAAAGRYGRGGDFWAANPGLPEKPIKTWQLWNEQNSPSFYKPKPNVKAYAKLLKAGERGIASEDSKATVILGGMFGTPLGGRKPGISSWKFLRKLYKVKGVKKTFDGVAPHPYAAQFKKVLAQVELMRDEMERARDSKTSLWITELGWASGGPKNPLNRGPRGQASRLKEAFKYFTKKRRKLNIRTVDWYSWRDNPDPDVGLCEWCAESGLVDENLEAKKSLKAFVKFTGGS